MGSSALYKLWSRSGKSQSSVARAVGLQPCTISQVLRGATGASIQTLAAICDELGATDAQAGKILREMAADEDSSRVGVTPNVQRSAA